MSSPIVFISRNRVKEGQLDEILKHYRQSLPLTEADKPGTSLQLAYVDEAGRDLVIVRQFPDAEAFDRQLQGTDERTRVSYQFIEPTGMEIYGQPNAYALEMISKVAGAGIDVKIYARFGGGFTRLTASGILA